MTAFYQLILRNNLLGMSNLSEFIQQLKSNQEAFNSKLAKVEDLGANVSKSVLRDLIQDARELHEGTVVLSYILFNEETPAESEQLEIDLEVQSLDSAQDDEQAQPLESAQPFDSAQGDTQEEVSEEELLMDALDEALEYTQQEIATENLVSDIAEEISEIEAEVEEVAETTVEDDMPTQEELTGQLEEEISSVISNFSASAEPKVVEEQEDNSLAAKLAKQRIENLNSAIGINEKFLFTNELFDGNTEQFLQTIDDLNNCSTLEEANTKLSSVAAKRNWEVEEEPYQKLQSLLSRKYQ